MNPISSEEALIIAKAKEGNNILDQMFENHRKEWTSQVNPLFNTLKNEFNLGNAPKIIDVQSLALSYRQRISEEISLFMSKRTLETGKITKLKQEKFLFYSTNFGLKTSMAEKTILIEAHLIELTRSVSLIENYIEFLRATNKTLESVGFVVKSIIELHTYLGK